MSQLLDCNLASMAVVADIEVLAKNTAEVAAGKKYGA
jgi:hypothetical protein